MQRLGDGHDLLDQCLITSASTVSSFGGALVCQQWVEGMCLYSCSHTHVRSRYGVESDGQQRGGEVNYQLE